MQPLLGRVCNDNHESAGKHGPGGACGRADQGSDLAQYARGEGAESREGGPGRCPLDLGDRLAVPPSDQPYLGPENTCRGLRVVAEIPTQWGIVASTLGCLIAS